ncbi:MAG TPA: hypothetical protein VK468_05315 [Pyrinomonadaceae bacterium]|nr:hypothetical protein [Pyrinomonadaceae bacterium]
MDYPCEDQPLMDMEKSSNSYEATTQQVSYLTTDHLGSPNLFG